MRKIIIYLSFYLKWEDFLSALQPVSWSCIAHPHWSQTTCLWELFHLSSSVTDTALITSSASVFWSAAQTDSKLWVIDRKSYQTILVQSGLSSLSRSMELLNRWTSACRHTAGPDGCFVFSCLQHIVTEVMLSVAAMLCLGLNMLRHPETEETSGCFHSGHCWMMS